MKPPTRRAFTLVELSVVIATSSIIMSSLAVSLHLMYRADRGVRDELAASAMLLRLSAQFRNDAHAAHSIVKQENADDDPAGDSLIMNLSDGQRIEYYYSAGSVQRVKRRGEERIHRDGFRLQPKARVQLLVRDDRDVQLAAVVISQQRPASEQLPVYRIEAAIGVDHLYREGEE